MVNQRLKTRIAVTFAGMIVLGGCHNEGWLPQSIHAPAEDEGPCNRSSWVAGITEYCKGRMIYRDYVYDDYGANSDNPSASTTGAFNAPAGDQRYPNSSVNTADLVALELWIENGRVHVKAELNALFRPDSTLLGLAIDRDDNPSTGGGTWSPLKVASQGWEELHVFSRGDPESNTISGSFPLPIGSRWRVQAATAQADGTVMNVAFRTPQESASSLGIQTGGGGGVWFEDKQAASLARGDISEFGHVVQVADLLNAVTRMDIVEPGLHERIYTSGYTLGSGEGMSYECIPGRGNGGGQVALGSEQNFCYFGRYQPYGIYVPWRGVPPYGMQMVFHGSNANHASLINLPGMQRTFGENLNRVLVVPLARGPNSYGTDISERDVLDVMADVERHYSIDPERVFAGGYSQGGYIALRMAELYPDRFAGLVSWVGFTGDWFNTPVVDLPVTYTAGAVGNVSEFVGNLRHIPSALIYATGDYLVHVHTALALEQEYAKGESTYEFFLHTAAEHLTFALLDEWDKEAAYTRNLTRVRNPARVTYATDPRLGNEEFGIYHDRAYWVSEIRGRVQGRVAIDLQGPGCDASTPVFIRGQDTGVNPAPWVSTYRRKAGVQPAAAPNRIAGVVSNVASLTLDGERLCLTSAAEYEIETDGPTTILLKNGSRIEMTSAGQHKGRFDMF